MDVDRLFVVELECTAMVVGHDWSWMGWGRDLKRVEVIDEEVYRSDQI